MLYIPHRLTKLAQDHFFGPMDPLKPQKIWVQGDSNSPHRSWTVEMKKSTKAQNGPRPRNFKNGHRYGKDPKAPISLEMGLKDISSRRMGTRPLLGIMERKNDNDEGKKGPQDQFSQFLMRYK
ncbi:hypothetical protein O181_002075 [Austropuccinia psidii MF-1]|uniref:Uncharacterized protein n=1 Tax=Austropuccinia psidii MF-1 TaxID=1389203 RepID=A0A9Q3BCC4_9BASI|nr:hypothetical protein [Austropuccinia psidii MF-1]